jgi:cell volume regulation protein A
MNDTRTFGAIVLGVALAAALALTYNRFSGKLRIPAPAVFLLAAAIASNLVPELSHVGINSVQRVVKIALVIILFDGGMHIGWRRFRKSSGTIAWVGVVGTFVTAGAMAVLAHYVFGFGWLLGLLLGTAIAPTDPAVVFSVLGTKEVTGSSGTILEGESGANDPVGIALMASLLSAGGLGGLAAVGEGALIFVEEMVIGGVIGVAGGLGLLWIMRHWPLPSGALYPLRTLFGVLIIYGAATVAHGSGFLAAFLAGVVLGDARAPYKGEIERFHSALSSLGEIVAFALLGLTIDLVAIWQDSVLGIGVAIAALLAFLVRPVLLGAMLAPVKVRMGERGFILFSGLKGAVPILLGTFILTSGMSGSQRAYEIIFVVVLFSVILQGGLVPSAAGIFKVPLRSVEPEPYALGVRFRDEPQALRRYVLQPGAPAEGTALEDLVLPESSWLSMVIRDGQLVPVSGQVVLQAGDEIVALSDPESEDPEHLFTRSDG